MANQMSVQVKRCQLRSKPTFLAKVMTELNYGERVTLESEEKNWAKVSQADGKASGWVHISALSSKEIVLQPGSEDVKKAASNDEIALAGKGFNEQVETKFKQDNKEIDFTWIDRMETVVITQNEMQSFLTSGGLQATGGDQS